MARGNIETESGDVDLTSMIDVCFLLIAFFIMVTEVSKAEIVEIFLPQASYATDDTSPPDGRVIINLTREGDVYIVGKKFGRPNSAQGKRDLGQELITLAKNVGFEEDVKGKPSKLTVLVRADAHCENRYIQCLQMLLVNARVMKVHYSANKPSEG